MSTPSSTLAAKASSPVKLSCQHRFTPCDVPDYEHCGLCGTYHSLKAPRPEEIYGKDYWSGKNGLSTFRDQNYNVEKHLERGLCKNEFVMNLIWTQDRSTALEIACAPGSLLRRLSDQFENVTGIEVDSSYDKDIQDMAGLKAGLLFGYFPEVTKEVFLSQEFSLIVGLDIFEHSHDPEAFLAECARLLKPDGQILLMTPMVDFPEWPKGLALPARFFHPIEHVYIHSYENLFHLLTDAGFAAVKADRWTLGHETITARKL